MLQIFRVDGIKNRFSITLFYATKEEVYNKEVITEV